MVLLHLLIYYVLLFCNCTQGVNRPPHWDVVLLISCTSGRSGASGQTSGQWLTYFIGLSWRNDRSIPSWVDGEEGAVDGAAEPGLKGRSQSVAPPVPHTAVLYTSSRELKQQARQKQMLG